MSATTNFAITTPTVDPDAVFAAARRIIGVPADHLPETHVNHLGETQLINVWRTPLLIVTHHDGKPVLLDVGDPEIYVRVALDTNFHWTDENRYDVLHRRITTELGAWCDEQGLDWWTCNDGIHHDRGWHHRLPAYIGAADV